MKKKILSMMLTIAMVLALCVPSVSAAELWKTNAGEPANWSNIPSSFYVTTDEHYSGSSCLFMNSTTDAKNDKYNMIQGIGTPDTNANYTLTFYAKEVNGNVSADGSGAFNDWTIQVRYSTGAGIAHCDDTAWKTTFMGNGWVKYETTYKPTNAGDPNIHIINNRSDWEYALPLYIDDISLVKEGTTENLVKNGGFEDYICEVTEPTISSVIGDGQLTVNWTNPSIASSALSMTINGQNVDISDASKAASANNSKVITGLKYGVDYTVVFTATTAQGDFSASVNSRVRAGNAGAPKNPWANVPSTYFLTSDIAISGDNALVVNGISSGDRLNMIQNIGTPDTNANYTLTFYAREGHPTFTQAGSLYAGWNFQVRYSTGAGVAHCNDTAWTKTDAGNGWFKYTATYKPTDASDSNLHIICNRDRDDMPIIIDNISLVKEGTTKNLIKDGDFEGVVEVTPPTIKAVAGDGEMTVNWTNPSIESSALKLTINGQNVDIADASKAANAANSKVITGLRYGVEYTVEITATTEEGDYAASATTKVRAGNAGLPGTPWGNVPDTYFITSDIAKSGSYALVVNGKTTGDVLNMIQGIGAPDTSAKYTLTFYVREGSASYTQAGGIYAPWNLQVRYASGTGAAHCGDSAWTVTDAGNGWWKYTATYAPTGTDDNLHIIFNRDRADMDMPVIIDDISLVKEGTDVNLIKNGGFEELKEFKPEVSATFADGEIEVFWTNPDAVSSEIIMTVDGETVLLDNVSLVAKAENSKTLSGLTNGKAYEIEVTCVTAYGEYSESLTVIPRKIEQGTAAGWSIDKAKYFNVTTSESKKNIAALRINVPKDTMVDGGNMEFTQEVTVEEGATYTVSFYAKIVKGNRWDFKVQLGGWQAWNLDNKNFWTMEDAGNGWVKYTNTEYTPVAGDGNIHIIVCNAAEKFMYLDDLVIVKNGDETNTNIVVNGDFESFIRITEAAAYGYCDSYNYLYWDIVGNADYFKIYKLVGDARTLIGATADGETDYFEVEAGISAGDKFVVTSVIDGEETDGIIIKEGINAYPIFAIGTVDGNGSVTMTRELNAIESGNIVAGAKIATSSETKVMYDMYIALYNGDLIKKAIKLDTNGVSDQDLMTTTATTIEIPEFTDGDAYSVGVMIWEDGTLKPLSERFELR